MNSLLRQLLLCPFCGGAFNMTATDQSSIEAGYGILSCYCSRFPVVAGIPVIKKEAKSNEVVSLIEAGQHFKALLALISPAPDNFSLPPIFKLFTLLPCKVDSFLKRMAYQKELQTWRKKASALLRNHEGETTTACDLLDFFFNNKEHYYYFAFRFGQPRHLVGLSLATLIQHPIQPLLDLSCGCGQMTRNLSYRAKDQLVVGSDAFFFGLYMAKHWIAPEAEYVCCSSDTALPFPDGSFSAIFCSDAFHYLINKVTTVRELKRLTQNKGLIILAWVQNTLRGMPNGVFQLPAEGYQELVADMPHRLVANKDVLSRYLQKRGPLLAQPTGIKSLRGEPSLSVIASHRQDLFRDYSLFDDWPHAEGRLSLNPLYVQEKRGENGCIFSREFPSRPYVEKHRESMNYLPEKIDIHQEILSNLANGNVTPEMDDLIRQCVLLDIPERFTKEIFSLPNIYT